MRVSAVGFLFQENINNGKIKGDNYTCIIHKLRPDGNYNKNIISSPLITKSTIETVSPEKAKANITQAIIAINNQNNNSKFIGATIKDGIKETEIHSLFSDKVFAVRTKDISGKDHFDILGKNKTQKLLAQNLYV